MENEKIEAVIKAFEENDYNVYTDEELKYEGLLKNAIRINRKNTDQNLIVDALYLYFYLANGGIYGYMKKLGDKFAEYDHTADIHFEDIKNQISIELVLKNVEIYEEGASLSFGDMALISTFQLDDKRIVINKQYLEKWNMSFYDILKIAYINVKSEIHNEIFTDKHIALTRFNNQENGAAAVLIDFAFYDFLKKEEFYSLLIFTSTAEALVTPQYPDTVKTSKDEIVNTWSGYINDMLRNNNTAFSNNVNWYDAEKDEIIFGGDKYVDVYPISELKAIFGA